MINNAELAVAKAQIACDHPSVHYTFPTDGGEPYRCIKCHALFTWDEIESLNVKKGGITGAFKS